MYIARLLLSLLSACTVVTASVAAPIVGSSFQSAQDGSARGGAPQVRGEALSVATAASASDSIREATMAGAPHQHGGADPPAILVFAAVLVVVVFVSTRRRPDR